MNVRLGLTLSVVSLALAGVGFGCSSSDDSSGGGDGGSSGSGASGSDGGAGDASMGAGGSGGGDGSGGGTGTGGTPTGGYGIDGAISEFCGGDGCACSNGVDDDGDGDVDGFDTECTGPLDGDEGTFATGIPGDNVDPKWQDCFFDGNSGAGNDGCRYHTDCLTGDKDMDDPDCQVSEFCINYCGDRTPNGCDCFGCCEIDIGTESVNVVIGSDCSLEDIDDETKCPRCVQTTQCGNECGECELCPGRTPEDLPDSCVPNVPDGGTNYPPDAPPPPVYTCDNGEQVCSLSMPCPSGYYCAQGCCLEVVQ
jgi:hypothetical protein